MRPAHGATLDVVPCAPTHHTMCNTPILNINLLVLLLYNICNISIINKLSVWYFSIKFVGLWVLSE